MLKPPYKNSKNRFMTAALFWDMSRLRPADERPVTAIFDLNDDRPGFINARSTFVELRDPTGYLWAMKYLGYWEHWEELMRCKWFKDAYNKWMVELNAKLRAEALDRISQIAQGNTQQALAAAKYLADLSKPTRGRPSKAEIQGELKREVEASKTTQSDAERIGLRVVS